jgi:phenylacetate-CoA ligase
MYWEKAFETLPDPDLRRLQVKRLRQTIQDAIRSPFYGELYRQKGITPERVSRVEDIRDLPFTTKQNWPFRCWKLQDYDRWMMVSFMKAD